MNYGGIGNEHLWSVVLAGGDGERTRPFIERWLGYHIPKQYCAFFGQRSLFQETVDRADRLASPLRRVAVVARSHEQEARAQLEARQTGIVLPQPKNRGTAPGIMLAIARILAEDARATVVLYPSDHFVRPEDAFIATVDRAVAAAEVYPDRLMILGVVPERPELDYGWIQPGPRINFQEAELHAVSAFVEKPSRSAGRAILANGGLWNSMVIIGKAGTFWSLGWRHVPEVMHPFASLRRSVGTSREQEVLKSIYEEMSIRDFSKDILEKAHEQLAVIRLADVMWSDWGRPERIAETLRSIGAQPAFSEEHLMARKDFTTPRRPSVSRGP